MPKVLCANNCLFSLKLQKIITVRIKEMIKTAGYESRYLEIPAEFNNYRRYKKKHLLDSFATQTPLLMFMSEHNVVL